MKKNLISIFIAMFVVSVVPVFLYAATIDSTDKYSEVMIDSFLGGTSQINWKPTGVTAVEITNTGLSGYIWSESFGWINLDPSGEGINNDGVGNLTGYAWGQNTGWINFDPQGGGVSIDGATGEFSGYAWGQNTGWIEFDCGSATACVKTDWRTGSGGGGGGGGDDEGEDDPITLAACENGSDDDLDGLVDYPSDPGCASAVDGSEYNAIPVPELCSDGVDNDGDGLTDYPADPGCSSFTDGNEYDAPVDEPCEGDDCVPPDVVCEGDDCSPVDETPDTPVDEGDDVPNDEGETFPGGIVNFFDDVSPYVTDAVVNVFEEIPLSPVIPAVIGIVAALMPLLFAASPSGVVVLPFQMWSIFFGRKRMEHPWGTVYDSITKRPLDPAYVVISRAPDPGNTTMGEQTGESITDMDGRYGFLVPRGSYVLNVGKTHYQFPSKNMEGKTKDELYDNLYFGEPFTIENDGDVVMKNIPMDPVGFDWNEYRKVQMGLAGRYRFLHAFLSKLSSALFVVGTLFAIVAYAVTPALWNAIILALYGIMISIRIVAGPLRPYGIVREKKTGVPLSFAIVRVFSTTGVEISHKVTDEEGRYYCLVPKGTYTVSIEKKRDDGGYEKIFTSSPITLKARFLNKKFSI